MYRFWRFSLKLPIHTPFWGVFGAYFPDMTSPIVMTPKRHFLGRKHVVWAIQRKNHCDGSTWPRDWEKNTGQQISHKSVIFSLFGGKPHWTNSAQKLHGGWCPRRNHVCQVLNWYLQVPNVRFSYSFLYGPVVNVKKKLCCRKEAARCFMSV